MRERITFLLNPSDPFDPQSISVNHTSISSVGAVTAAKEVKIKFEFKELPEELQRVLKVSRELHVRWVAEKEYESVSPLVSRLSPGLHVLYAPRSDVESSKLLCTILKEAFGPIDCISPQRSFTPLYKETSYLDTHLLQFYSPLSSIAKFEEYLQNIVCSRLPPSFSEECSKRLSSLISATYLDISFTGSSQSLSISSFAPTSAKSLFLQFSEELSIKYKTRHEIGFLTSSKANKPEDISISGFLTVIGDNKKLNPTLFSLTSRHHSSNVNFSARFLGPSGMHPTLELRISDTRVPHDFQACRAHVLLTLPQSIFVDKYQLSDPLFLQNKNLSALRRITDDIDLEAPAYNLPTWGSSVLIELATPEDNTNHNQPLDWTAQIPMHLRYLMPSSNSSGLRDIEVPYPVVFWACNSGYTLKFSNNPFDRPLLGYENSFGEKYIFYHLNPKSIYEDRRLVNKLQVPVLDLDQDYNIKAMTYLAVGIGFMWVMHCLLRVEMKSRYSPNRKSVVKKQEKLQ
ncbi:BgTH12-04964 [Blumeria graminis f. sp. triticale]|uniref:Protein PBN1 n=3 Tax=Blumeria graminis TaxID=34373 RepID=A0A381LL58_BLUGR|nr:component of glycosylphosphatidylinositol-mannosyltransferase I [Blumeria graminis f. sp. tritici 96224]CAD6502372.1 BgTH12-04964 [Blumeria graminis f. sp. triticale]VDB87642.1 Bgt-341 [Blumeria graminis f. sp. tritici]